MLAARFRNHRSRSSLFEQLEQRALLSATAAAEVHQLLSFQAESAASDPTIVGRTVGSPSDSDTSFSSEIRGTPVLAAAGTANVTALDALSTTQPTSKDPQSKVWTYDGQWWSVLADSTGTWVFRLDGTSWTSVLKLGSSSGNRADIKVAGNVVHVLLQKSATTQLASIQYVPGNPGTYALWSVRPALAVITSISGQSQSIDIDSTGRMWMVQDTATSGSVIVQYSDSPYSTWSAADYLGLGPGNNRNFRDHRHSWRQDWRVVEQSSRSTLRFPHALRWHGPEHMERE